MKDDFLDKLKTILTGSVKLNKSTNNDAQNKEIDEELVNNFMNQILDASWVEEDLKAMCAPSYHLSKKQKSYWLMNVTAKIMFNINGGVELIPVEAGEPNTTCLIGQSMFSIPNKLIICSGWN